MPILRPSAPGMASEGLPASGISRGTRGSPSLKRLIQLLGASAEGGSEKPNSFITALAATFWSVEELAWLKE